MSVSHRTGRGFPLPAKRFTCNTCSKGKQGLRVGNSRSCCCVMIPQTPSATGDDLVATRFDYRAQAIFRTSPRSFVDLNDRERISQEPVLMGCYLVHLSKSSEPNGCRNEIPCAYILFRERLDSAHLDIFGLRQVQFKPFNEEGAPRSLDHFSSQNRCTRIVCGRFKSLRESCAVRAF